MSQLQIDQMTLEEKLRIMEAIWDDLRSRPEDVPVPHWHHDVLDERERLVETGEAQYGNWETAKKRIADQVS